MKSTSSGRSRSSCARSRLTTKPRVHADDGAREEAILDDVRTVKSCGCVVGEDLHLVARLDVELLGGGLVGVDLVRRRGR